MKTITIHRRAIKSILCIALGLSSSIIIPVMRAISSEAGTKALMAEEIKQKQRDGVIAEPIEELIESKEPDRFTQTEAHLSLKDMRDLIEKTYDITPYLNLISSMIAKEGEYKNDYYVFYHTTANPWRLAQDLHKLLYARFSADSGIKREFKFLRFSGEHAVNTTPQEFLLNELKTKGLVDDNTETKFLMISVNLALFGNVGFPGECSWEYFIKPQEHAKPIRGVYQDMMGNFGLTDQYIDEIMSLADIYDTQEDTIIQIFVPKNKVDEIGYLAWVKGIPAHSETIDWILKNAKGKSFTKHVKPTMEKLTEDFSQAKEDNPLYDHMIQSIQAGDFSLEAFLKVYRNQPWKLKNINDVSARLLFTPDVLLNPDSGVKYYRYSTATRNQLKEYHKKLDEVVNKLVADKESRQEDTRGQEDTKAEEENPKE